MLRQKTQRRLFRVLFLLGCVLPTLAVASWSAVRMHPQYQHWMLSLAGYSLGVDLQCDQIATPRPGEYEIEGLRVSHAGKLIAECNRIHVQQTNDSWRFVGDECVLTISEKGYEKISGNGSLTTVEGKIASFTVADPTGEAICSWRHVQCRIDGERASVDDPIAAVWTEADEPSEAAQLTLYRNDKNLRIEFQTGSTPLPLRLVPGVLPENMAHAASFSGVAAAEVDGDQHLGQAKGVIKLNELVGSHASWSNAEVNLLDLTWNGKQIERLHAHLEAREGSLNRLFVWGLYQMLKCHPEQALETLWNNSPNDAPIPFGHFACEVELDSSGLSIYGRCGNVEGQKRPGAIAHAVLSEGDDPLLLEPRERMQPPTNLVRALWPDQTPAIPATSEAQEMASRLPEQTSAE